MLIAKGTGVFVGGIGVGGRGVLEGGIGVFVGGTGVFDGIGVCVGGGVNVNVRVGSGVAV